MSNLPDLIEQAEPDTDMIEDNLMDRFLEWAVAFGTAPTPDNFELWIEKNYD